MQKKTISIIILFAILSLSLISLISADYQDGYIYAGNGVIVYPGYILKQVCHPFMPCGVERINIPSYNQYNYNTNTNTVTGDGDALSKEFSSPGFSQVIADQRSATYDPLYDSNNYNQQNYRNKNYNQDVIIYTRPHQDDTQIPIKHFANTYNTRNNYDSNGNWIEQEPVIQIVDHKNTNKQFSGALLVESFRG